MRSVTDAPRGEDDDMGSEDVFVEAVPHRSHKDTRRWCKGRPGRAHQPQIMIAPNLGWPPDPTCHARSWFGSGWCCYHAEVCTVCGKHLRGWGFLAPQECPDYDDDAAMAAVAERAAR